MMLQIAWKALNQETPLESAARRTAAWLAASRNLSRGLFKLDILPTSHYFYTIIHKHTKIRCYKRCGGRLLNDSLVNLVFAI